MGQKHSRRVLIHICWIGAEVDIGNALGQLSLAFPEIFGNEHHVRSHQRRVSDISKLFPLDVWQQPDSDGILED